MKNNTLIILLALAATGTAVYFYLNNNKNSENSGSDSSGGSGGNDNDGNTVSQDDLDNANPQDRSPGSGQTAPGGPATNPIAGGGGNNSGGNSSGGSGNNSGGNSSGGSGSIQANPAKSEPEPETEQTNKEAEQVEYNIKTKEIADLRNNKVKTINKKEIGTNESLKATDKAKKSLKNGTFRNNKFLNG